MTTSTWSSGSEYTAKAQFISGIGIRSEDLPRIFGDFQRLDEDHNYRIEGTGLGLILCKEFVEKNNGKIWATSTKDSGSTFLFTMPKAM